MLTCLDPNDFVTFIELVKDIVIAVTGDTVVLNTEANGHVRWSYDYVTQLWCIK